jgi:Ubiquinol-cytochrome C chaperone
MWRISEILNASFCVGPRMLLLYRRWFGPGRVSRAFRSRHAILTFHTWLLHKRLLADTYDKESALAVDEELFGILWDDTTCRIRQAGVYELAVNKHLLQVQQYTFVHMTHYDHCYTERFLLHPVDRLLELRQVVWLHWFQSDPAVEHCTDYLDRLCWYIDANVRNVLLEWPDEYYRQARVGWVDLPDFSHVHDEHGVVLPENPVHADDALPHPWLGNITSRGVEYYWNPITGEARYDRPT